MGQRFRLKASVNESAYPASVRPIIRALKTYGAINADNGSAWFMSGVPDPRWNNDDLQALRRLRGSRLRGHRRLVAPGVGQQRPGPEPLSPRGARRAVRGRPGALLAAPGGVPSEEVGGTPDLRPWSGPRLLPPWARCCGG